LAKGKKEQPSAAIFDGRTVQSTPESGERAGYDGYKRKKGSKIHIAVDTLGLLLAAHVTPANEQERAQVKELAQAVQEVTQNSVEVAFVDQGYTGPLPEKDAKEAGIELIVVKLPEPKKGLSSYPDAGWWSAVSPGLLVFEGWPVTLSEPQKPSAVSISLPSLSLCFIILLNQSLMSFESA